MFKIAVIIVGCILSTSLLAKSKSGSNLLAIGQGISSPSMTSTVNYTNGWSHENPVGVIYQEKVRVSADYVTGSNSSAYGGELGMGSGSFGFSLGYLNSDCDSCDGSLGAALAGTFGKMALGIGYHEDSLSLGMMISPDGDHRIGITADINGGSISNKVFGLGYSYVGAKFRFAVDATKRVSDSVLIDNDAILITPGFSFQLMDYLALSLSYDNIVNSSVSSGGDLWYGIGIGTGDNWHIAIYGDYVSDWSLAASFFF